MLLLLPASIAHRSTSRAEIDAECPDYLSNDKVRPHLPGCEVAIQNCSYCHDLGYTMVGMGTCSQQNLVNVNNGQSLQDTFEEVHISGSV